MCAIIPTICTGKSSRTPGVAMRHSRHGSHARTELWGAIYMAHVKLFGQTYVLPSIANARFCLLQQQLNEQSLRLQAGVGLGPRWLRVVHFSSAPLSSKERFQQVDLLVSNYEAIIDELRASQDAYQRFFAQLAAGIRQALDAKGGEMRSIEQERRASYQEALAQRDEVLMQLALE